MTINCARCAAQNDLDEGAELQNAYCGTCFAPLSQAAQTEIAGSIEHNKGEIQKLMALKIHPVKTDDPTIED